MCDRGADGCEAGSSCSAEFQRKLVLKTDSCRKCCSKATVLLRGRDAYCNQCLHAYVTHKFRSCLGKSKMMKSGDTLLVACSGGLASTAMLKLLKESLLETSQKKLKLIPAVVYIDEQGLLQRSLNDRTETIKEVCSVISTYEFPVYVSSLEMVMAPDDDGAHLAVDMVNQNISEFFNLQDDNWLKRLQDLFLSVKSQSSKEDLLLKFRCRLLARIARRLGYRKVFLGDTETRIAVRVLADIALGKGQHLSRNCGFADDRYDDVVFIRPLRELVAKEVACYAHSLNLDMVSNSKLNTKVDSNDSIQRKTELFVFGLQEEFSSTISTIFRVGDKMGCSSVEPASKPAEQQHLDKKSSCILCSGPLLDVQQEVLSSYRPLQNDVEIPNRPVCSVVSDCLLGQTSHQESTTSLLSSLACYSCRLILRETDDIQLLPPEILINATNSEMRRQKMKSEIKDVLLTEEQP